MPIKKTKLSHKSKSKRFFKKIRSSKKTQKHKKMRLNSKTKSSKYKHYKHHGGFTSNCNMATVKEPGFSIDAIGSIAGINIPSSRAAIYRPNCKTSSGSGYSDAMIP